MESNRKIQFAPIKKVNLSQQLVEILINNIENGRFPLRERIPDEISLAAQFNVSRNILRESMKILENYGILHTVNGKGTMVSESAIANIQSMRFFEKLRNDTSVLQFLEARLIMEPTIAYYACLNCTEQDIENLRYIVSIPFSEELPANRTDDYDFHIALSRICRNEVLSDFLYTIICRLREGDYANFNKYVELVSKENSEREHEAILDACIRRDPEAARSIMAKHLQDRIFIIQSLYRPDIDPKELNRPALERAVEQFQLT